jgi:hypothetical protein
MIVTYNRDLGGIFSKRVAVYPYGIRTKMSYSVHQESRPGDRRRLTGINRGIWVDVVGWDGNANNQD